MAYSDYEYNKNMAKNTPQKEQKQVLLKAECQGMWAPNYQCDDTILVIGVMGIVH